MRIERLLAESAALHPGKAAIVCGDRRISYAEFASLTDRLACNLAARGVARGDRVVVLMDNIWEAAVSIYAVLRAGAVFCPVNPSIHDDGLRHVVENTGARVILTQARFAARCREIGGDAVLVIAARMGARQIPDILAFEACLAEADMPLPAAEADSDLAMIIHTSGSTGKPKGVMMSHANMDFASATIARYLENTQHDVVLGVLPLSFTYGLYQLLVTVRVGATLVLQKSFAFPADVLETARAEGVTGLPLVPTMAAVLLSMRDGPGKPLPSLRYITNAAAPLSPAQVCGLRRLFGDVDIYAMYGLTECARAAYLAPAEIEWRPDSVGKPLDGTRIVLIGEDGHAVAQGETGQLVVSGPHVMQGYWQDPAATCHALRTLPGRGGVWLHTGDLFRMDAEGYLYFVGRNDDMLKVRGEKVAPRQVEAALMAHPGVIDAVVVGLPDPVAGHVLHAVVVRSSDALDERELLRHCARALPDVMVPKSVEFRSELPKTASGKVARRLVA